MNIYTKNDEKIMFSILTLNITVQTSNLIKLYANYEIIKS